MSDRYFHLDVNFMFKNTGRRLLHEFGSDGLLTWIAMLAQAKNGRPPGTIEYPTDEHFWAQIGFNGTRPSFTLDEFLKVTGQLKQTRKTPVGHMKHIEITQYGRWQKDKQRQQNAERQRRYRAKNKEEASVTGNALRGVTGASPRTRTRTRTTPRYENEQPKGSWCTEGCGQLPPGVSLGDHLRNTHGLDVN